MNHGLRWLTVAAVGMALALTGTARETAKSAKSADKGDAKDGKAAAAAPAKDAGKEAKAGDKDAKEGEEKAKYPDFASLDSDGDEGVTLNEFLGAHVPPGKPAGQIVAIPLQQQLKLRRDFKDADHDRSNILTKGEWEKFTGRDAERAAKAAARAAEQKKQDGDDEIAGMDRKDWERLRRNSMRQQLRIIKPGG